MLQMLYCDAIPVVEKLVEDVAGSDNGSVTDGSDICWHSGYVWHPMAPNPFTICILFTNTDHLAAPDFFLILPPCELRMLCFDSSFRFMRFSNKGDQSIFGEVQNANKTKIEKSYIWTDPRPPYIFSLTQYSVQVSLTRISTRTRYGVSGDIFHLLCCIVQLCAAHLP